MTFSVRGAAAVVLPVALATPLAAQTLPVPTLAPETSTADGAERPVTAATAAPGTPLAPPNALDPAGPARPRDWEYAVGLGAGWDSNIAFEVPGGPRGSSLLPRGGLARIFSGPHGRLRAIAAGGWTGYPDQRPLSRHYGEVGLDGHYQPSPATFWQANVSRSFGQGDSTRVLVEQGLSLPLVDTRSVAAGLGLRKTGPGHSIRLEARYYRTEFDSPVLIDGQSMRGTAGFQRPLGDRTTAALEYALESVRSDQGRSYLTHFASLQWTRRVSPRSALLLEAGASYTPDATRAGLDQKESFFGGASFSRLVRRSSLMVFVRREVTPAFGIGVSRLALRAGVGATLPWGRTWELRATGTHVRPETPDAVAQVYGPSDDLYAALVRRLGRHLEVSAEARYRRRAASAVFPALESIQAGVFVTVASPAGRSLAPAPGR